MATYTGVAYPRQRSRTRNQRRRKLFARQKLMGVVLLLITIGVFWMASTGTTFEDKDCTAALITLPFGLYPRYDTAHEEDGPRV